MRDPAGKGIYFVSGKSSALLTAFQGKGQGNTDVIADDVSQPIVSPDGKRIMYIRYLDPGRTELWVSGLDGSNRLKLASGANLGTLDWSPDGLRLTYADNAQTFVIGADGRGLQELRGTDGPVAAGMWSVDGMKVFVSTVTNSGWSIWTADADGSHVEKLPDPGFAVMAQSRDGKYVGCITVGSGVGNFQTAMADKRRVPLLPGVVTFMVWFAPDYKSFVYAVAGRGEVIFYRQGWQDGALVGKPQIALKVPFAFPLAYKGNAFDFSRDLSKIVYVRPSGQHDLYFLSHAQ
jgi:hypothetical protein